MRNAECVGREMMAQWKKMLLIVGGMMIEAIIHLGGNTANQAPLSVSAPVSSSDPVLCQSCCAQCCENH